MSLCFKQHNLLKQAYRIFETVRQDKLQDLIKRFNDIRFKIEDILDKMFMVSMTEAVQSNQLTFDKHNFQSHIVSQLLIRVSITDVGEGITTKNQANKAYRGAKASKRSMVKGRRIS